MSVAANAAPPSWWAARGVTTAAPASDYGAINQGQIKWLATEAMQELNQKLPGGAGEVIQTMVAAWATPGANTADYATANLGQLKAVAKPFYDRLIAIGYASAYPWVNGAASAFDYEIANIGQAKNLFSFDVAYDSNSDGLPDWWEKLYFGGLNVNGNALAPNGGGLTILQCYQQQINPWPALTLSISPSTAVAPGAFTLTATPATNGLARIDFFQNGTFLGSDTSSPWQWPVSNLTAGNYTYSAIGYNSNGIAGPTSWVTGTVTQPPPAAAPSTRYVFGQGSDPNFQSYVVAVDFEKGVPLEPTGHNFDKFPAAGGDVTKLPWFLRTFNPGLSYHIASTGGVITYPLAFENPSVAFGAEGGGSPLYTGQSYTIGLGSGGQVGFPNDFVISAYKKSDFGGGSLGVVGVQYPFSLPLFGTSQWDTFAQNGYVYTADLTTTVQGGEAVKLLVKVQFVPGGATDQWGQRTSAPFLVTVTSTSTDFYFVINYRGAVLDANNNAHWMAVADPAHPTDPSVATGRFWYAFSFDFQDRPPWRSVFVDQPQFAGTPLPSAYQGKTVDELLHDAPPVSDTFTTPGANLLNVDNSPELRSHPILDQFVSDMGNDPFALVNYVLNEIELTDAISYNDNGSLTETSINEGGVNRGALATLIEGQGSPAEQCALTVYLLRKAGYPCGYVYGAHNGLLMFDEQLSKLLRMQLRGAVNDLGTSNVPELIPTNYPWVAAYINGKWVHIFPWLKDTAIEEGQDLYQYLPAGYNTGRLWLQKYLTMDSTIRGLSTEYDNPGALFPLYVSKQLQLRYPAVSIAQLGVTMYNRKNYFTRWEDMPRPWQTPAVSNGNLLENLSAIPNIFDTVNIQVFSDRNSNGTADSGEPLLQTGVLRSLDLHDRRFLLYHTKTGTNTHNMILSLEAFRPNATGSGTFMGGDPLLNKQIMSVGLSSADDALVFNVTYDRHRSLATSVQSVDHWTPFLGLDDTLELTDSRPLRKGDMAAFVMNYGRVTQSMLNLQAGKYWSAQQFQLRNPASSVDLEVSAGLPAYLMGLSYYYNVSQSQYQLLSLTKTNILSFFAHGFSKLSPQRDATTGALPNNGDITLVYPKVDMSFQRMAWAGNGTLHPDSGLPQTSATNSWFDILAGETSAQEHRTINKFFQKNDSISTVKLFDLGMTVGVGNSGTFHNASMTAGLRGIILSTSQATGLASGETVTSPNITGGSATITITGAPAPIGPGFVQVLFSQPFIATMVGDLQIVGPKQSPVLITALNYDINWASSPWNTVSTTANVNGTYMTKTLAQWAGYDPAHPTAPSLYNTIVNGFINGPNPEYQQVYITPAPVTGAGGAYQGMGAFIIGTDSAAAAITDSMVLSNGGFASKAVSPFDTQPLTLEGSFINFNSDGSLSYIANNTTIVAPPVFSIADASTVNSYIAAGTWSLDTIQSQTISAAANSLNYTYSASTTQTALAQLLLLNSGAFASASSNTVPSNGSKFWGTMTSWFGPSISDPVNAITGEFYIDAVDLRLNGPMPLEVRRNYGSQSLSDSIFGYGWKPAYVPYLVISTDSTLIYATEMDGSVIAYRQSSPATRWIPSVADNPQLANMAGDSMGSVHNLFNNRIDQTTSGGSTFYTLTGVDGSIRTFQVHSYPTPGANGLTRQRPYLQKWQDNRGNFYTFTFGEDNTAPEYGQLVRIAASNGNFVGFRYDTYGHTTQAFTGDGRVLQYQYDDYGDLVQVTLPDASTIGYIYSHQPNAGGAAGFYSEHLIVQENKPGGRLLANVYDSATSRRVTHQQATVGADFTPVTNATFDYVNTTSATDHTITGLTIIRDVFNRETRYDYQKGQITKITDPLNQTVTQTWFLAGDGLPGSYPQSLKSRTDKRGLLTEFQYDAMGNLVQTKQTGDLTGSGAGGDTATSTSTYNGLNMVTQTVDPIGNVTNYTYGNASYPYLPMAVEKRAPGGTISTTKLAYQDVAAGGATSYGLVQTVTKAFGTSDAAVTQFTNNANGFATSMTRATGTTDAAVTVNYTYNLRGELTSETDAAGRTTRYAYDGLGRRTAQERYDQANTLVSWLYYYYNLNGEVEWIDGPRYGPEDYIYRQYDGAGRMSQEIKWRSEAVDATGVQAVQGIDAAYATTFYTHNAFGDLTEVRDPRQNSTTMTYDGIGQMLTRSRHNGGSSAPAVTETFSYEPGGKVSVYKNPLQVATSSYYNSRGQLRRQVNADGSVLEWRYDLDGRVVKKTLSNGSYRITCYDDFARTVTHTLKSSGGSVLAVDSAALDRRGNVLVKIDAESNVFTSTYDLLDRVKTSTGPAATGSTANQMTVHSYDASGIWHIVADAANNRTLTVFDAEGRPVRTQVLAPNGQVVSQNNISYSPDHNSVTTTAGTGATAVTNTVYTNTFGQTVLAKHGDGKFALSTYDSAGNLVATDNEHGDVTSFTYDGLNRVATQSLPAATVAAEAVTTFTYDDAGNMLQRQMPGGAVETKTYDTIGRPVSSSLTNGSNVTRQFTYTYFASGDPAVGKLATVGDPRGFSTAYGYDDYLRPASITSSLAAVPAQNQTTNFIYDRRNLVKQITQNYAVGATGPPTEIDRSYDGYGQMTAESVSVSSAVVSQWQQSWDASGRRSTLASQLAAQGAGVGANYSYQYRADGLLTQVTDAGQTFGFSYADNGLLQSRTNASRTQTISYDTRGRRTGASNTLAGSVFPLGETMTWREDAKLSSYTANRTGTGVWNETRNYDYSVRGQLLSEPYAPSAGATAAFSFQFDGNTESGPGVRSLAQADPQTLDQVTVQNPLMQVTGETQAPGSGTTTAVTWTYDALGNVLTRSSNIEDSGHLVISTQPTQTFTWDSFGRLVGVQTLDTSSNGSSWTAIYDGLGRRVQTATTSVAAGVPQSTPDSTVTSFYDPLVEFLELGVAVNGVRTWKVQGPDLNGTYGGLQGTGGLEAVIDETSGTVTGALNNTFGDVVASVSGADLSWNSAQVGGYGLLPGSSAALLENSASLLQATVWRSHRQDPTGFYYLGARYYDPTSGRFLSPDPLGHGSDMSLYAYCNGDPVNGLDPDGRFGAAQGHNAAASGAWAWDIWGNVVYGTIAFGSNLASQTAGRLADDVTGGGLRIEDDLSDLGDWSRSQMNYLEQRKVYQNNSFTYAVQQVATMLLPMFIGKFSPSEVAPMTYLSDEVTAESSTETGAMMQQQAQQAQSRMNNIPTIFQNQRPRMLATEIADAAEVGVTPQSLKNPDFVALANSGDGTIKYVVTQSGELIVAPYSVNGIEISHAVLSGGQAVRTAGQAQIAVADGQNYIFNITVHSGHFLFGATDAVNAVAISRAEAAFKASGFTLIK